MMFFYFGGSMMAPLALVGGIGFLMLLFQHRMRNTVRFAGLATAIHSVLIGVGITGTMQQLYLVYNYASEARSLELTFGRGLHSAMIPIGFAMLLCALLLPISILTSARQRKEVPVFPIEQRVQLFNRVVPIVPVVAALLMMLHLSVAFQNNFTVVMDSAHAIPMYICMVVVAFSTTLSALGGGASLLAGLYVSRV